MTKVAAVHLIQYNLQPTEPNKSGHFWCWKEVSQLTTKCWRSVGSEDENFSQIRFGREVGTKCRDYRENLVEVYN